MAGKFLANWTPDDARALAAWQARCVALGIDIAADRVKVRGAERERVRAPSDVAAVREALRFALKARTVTLPRPPGDRSPAPCVVCGRDVEEARRCYAYPTCYTCLPPPPPLPVLRAADDAPATPTNPLRSLREGAGLSQKQMADKLGVSKRAVQLQEARASASPEMVARARKAIGGGK